MKNSIKYLGITHPVLWNGWLPDWFYIFWSKTMCKINFTPFPNLTTERLILRQVEIEDENEIFLLRSDSKVNKYLDRSIAKTIDDTWQFINKTNDPGDSSFNIQDVLTKISGDDGKFQLSDLTELFNGNKEGEAKEGEGGIVDKLKGLFN